MIRRIVLTVAAAFCIALTKRRRPTMRGSFENFEMSADDLKAAVKKVDIGRSSRGRAKRADGCLGTYTLARAFG